MILVLEKIQAIVKFLETKIQQSVIIDYRITLKLLDTQIKIFVLVDPPQNSLVQPEFQSFLRQEEIPAKQIDLELVTSREQQFEDFYKFLFSDQDNPKKVNLTFRRGYSNLIDYHKSKRLSSVPIVTFYSYKGGVGRTTTLAAFAAYYAMHERKTVVIIDGDWEAPGMTNFFGITPELSSPQTNGTEVEATSQSGVVEYFLDRAFLGREGIMLENYIIKISDEYTSIIPNSSEGQVYLMPAGQLSSVPVTAVSSNTHLDHYLEALARLNISGTEQMEEQFGQLLEHLETELKPDVILLDSRTGFNDIFANIGLAFSSMIVGFFASDKQTLPGLHFFLSNPALEDKNIILVNAIIPNYEHFEVFCETVREIGRTNLAVDADAYEERLNNLSMFPIVRNSLLESLGTKLEHKLDFIPQVKRKALLDHVELFEEIIKKLGYLEKTGLELEDESDYPKEVVTSGGVRETPPALLTTIGGDEIERLKQHILTAFQNHLPQHYAEHVDAASEGFLREQFYWRECMNKLFNRDKILLLGSKGTGKTFLYKTLSTNQQFLELLRERNAERERYRVINIISLKEQGWESPQQRKYLELSLFSPEDYQHGDFFFRRFWQVYTWNAIWLSSAELGLSLPTTQLSAYVKPLQNDIETRQRFLELIHSEANMSIIEANLKHLDALLRQEKINLMLTYDQLDYVIKPNEWSTGIAPLINYWMSHSFVKLHPKLFVRRDLFAKLGNITNKQSLSTSRILDLEWRKEELFGVFFKLIFSRSKEDFFRLMKLVGTYSGQQILEIRNAIDRDNQVVLDDQYLRPLVETFFGKWVETGGYPVETYQWFYKNLCNADGTISLRPFLDLLENAIDCYFGQLSHSSSPTPVILAPRYFTNGEVRKQAVARHFNDLASEAGSEDLKRIFSYIQLHAPASLRKSFLTKAELERLFENVVETYSSEMEHQRFDDLSKLMIDSGIIRLVTGRGGVVFYSFAFLYKYYLGLSSKR